jgi:hypothetical protein
VLRIGVTINSKFYTIRFKNQIQLGSNYIFIYFLTINYLVLYYLWRNIWIAIHGHPDLVPETEEKRMCMLVVTACLAGLQLYQINSGAAAPPQSSSTHGAGLSIWCWEMCLAGITALASKTRNLNGLPYFALRNRMRWSFFSAPGDLHVAVFFLFAAPCLDARWCMAFFLIVKRTSHAFDQTNILSNDNCSNS